MDHKNPLKMIDPVTGVEMTMQPPMPANQMGAAKPMFDQTTQNVAQQVYGGLDQRQMSMGAQAPVFFTDQTGDGEITQADVIKARTEGYEESPNTMRSPLDIHKPGHVEPRGPRNSVRAVMIGKEIPKKQSKTLTEKKPQPYTKKQLEARNATIKQAYGITKDGKEVNLGTITSTEISPEEFKQR